MRWSCLEALTVLAIVVYFYWDDMEIKSGGLTVAVGLVSIAIIFYILFEVN